MTTPRLDVMIVTHGEKGLERITEMNLPAVEGVRYLVSCQSAPMPTPAPLLRDDVEIHFTDTTGTSANRNNLLRLATAPYALVGDNDLIYSPEGLRAVIRAFDEHPEIDIATFRSSGANNKHYPTEERSLDHRIRNYHVTAFEIALRTESVRRTGLEFNLLMTPGAPYLHGGEEILLMLNAARLGLRGRFFPVTICEHPGLTTGYRKNPTPGFLRAQGALIGLDYTLSSLPRLALKAKRSGGFFPATLLYLFQGWLYGLRHRRELLVARR